MRAAGITLKVLLALFLFPWVLISLLTFYWELRRPPSFETDPRLELETWIAVSGDTPQTLHNSNTDLIHYRGSFFLVHAQTQWHLEDRKGALVVQRSQDARSWEEVARIMLPGTDVRDPKFAIIGGRLFLYFLPNKRLDPFPHTTYWTVSEDGLEWPEPRELDTVTVLKRRGGQLVRVTEAGWKLWRPKTQDGETWYVVGFGVKPPAEHTITVLLRSRDGIHWEEVSEVYSAHGNGEPTLEFTEDGRAIATLRCGTLGVGGYQFGNPTGNTIIATARPPYTEWSYAHSFITRFDGATLFRLGDRIFGVGRNHLGPRIDMGNHVARKRTSFYLVEPGRLIHLFDLPSNGDTAYTGVVVREDWIYTSYYTCPIEKDYPWVYGIAFRPRTDIRMARVSKRGLLRYVEENYEQLATGGSAYF